jgi:hypothetical protein
MDSTLIVLIAGIVLMVLVSSRSRSRWSSPGYQYQRVISAAVFGLALIVAGATGWDVSHLHGVFRGAQSVEAPIWWQIGLGVLLIAVAVFLARRVPRDATRTPSSR